MCVWPRVVPHKMSPTALLSLLLLLSILLVQPDGMVVQGATTTSKPTTKTPTTRHPSSRTPTAAPTTTAPSPPPLCLSWDAMVNLEVTSMNLSVHNSTSNTTTTAHVDVMNTLMSKSPPAAGLQPYDMVNSDCVWWQGYPFTPSIIYQLTVTPDVQGKFTITVEGDFDVVLALVTCPSQRLVQCRDDGDGRDDSTRDYTGYYYDASIPIQQEASNTVASMMVDLFHDQMMLVIVTGFAGASGNFSLGIASTPTHQIRVESCPVVDEVIPSLPFSTIMPQQPLTNAWRFAPSPLLATCEQAALLFPLVPVTGHAYGLVLSEPSHLRLTLSFTSPGVDVFYPIGMFIMTADTDSNNQTICPATVVTPCNAYDSSSGFLPQTSTVLLPAGNFNIFVTGDEQLSLGHVVRLQVQVVDDDSFLDVVCGLPSTANFTDVQLGRSFVFNTTSSDPLAAVSTQALNSLCVDGDAIQMERIAIVDIIPGTSPSLIGWSTSCCFYSLFAFTCQNETSRATEICIDYLNPNDMSTFMVGGDAVTTRLLLVSMPDDSSSTGWNSDLFFMSRQVQAPAVTTSPTISPVTAPPNSTDVCSVAPQREIWGVNDSHAIVTTTVSGKTIEGITWQGDWLGTSCMKGGSHAFTVRYHAARIGVLNISLSWELENPSVTSDEWHLRLGVFSCSDEAFLRCSETKIRTPPDPNNDEQHVDMVQIEVDISQANEVLYLVVVPASTTQNVPEWFYVEVTEMPPQQTTASPSTRHPTVAPTTGGSTRHPTFKPTFKPGTKQPTRKPSTKRPSTSLPQTNAPTSLPICPVHDAVVNVSSIFSGVPFTSQANTWTGGSRHAWDQAFAGTSVIGDCGPLDDSYRDVPTYMYMLTGIEVPVEYEYEPKRGHTLVIDVSSSQFDVMVALVSCPTQNLLACNDDYTQMDIYYNGYGYGSLTDFDVLGFQAHLEYTITQSPTISSFLILVTGFQGHGGDFNITMSCSNCPTQDHTCMFSQRLVPSKTFNTSVTFTTIDDVASGEVVDLGDPSSSFPVAIYSFTIDSLPMTLDMTLIASFDSATVQVMNLATCDTWSATASNGWMLFPWTFDGLAPGQYILIVSWNSQVDFAPFWLSMSFRVPFDPCQDGTTLSPTTTSLVLTTPSPQTLLVDLTPPPVSLMGFMGSAGDNCDALLLSASSMVHVVPPSGGGDDNATHTYDITVRARQYSVVFWSAYLCPLNATTTGTTTHSAVVKCLQNSDATTTIAVPPNMTMTLVLTSSLNSAQYAGTFAQLNIETAPTVAPSTSPSIPYTASPSISFCTDTSTEPQHAVVGQFARHQFAGKMVDGVVENFQPCFGTATRLYMIQYKATRATSLNMIITTLSKTSTEFKRAGKVRMGVQQCDANNGGTHEVLCMVTSKQEYEIVDTFAGHHGGRLFMNNLVVGVNQTFNFFVYFAQGEDGPTISDGVFEVDMWETPVQAKTKSPSRRPTTTTLRPTL